MKQVVIGRAGSGKTHYITERIKEDLAAGYENILVIVPDQFTFETERELIRQTGKGLFAIRVLSIRRLIDVLRDELGTKGTPVLDDVNKAMFVNKLLYDYDNELTVYKNAYRTPGFSYDMAKAITECKQFGVSYEELESLEVQGKTKSKLGDIGEIYKAYTNFKGGFVDNEDVINTITGRLKNSRQIQGARIYIDHFDVFTHQGYAMIEEMSKVCSSLCVCLCTDGSRGGLFSMTTKTLEQIRTLIPDIETVALEQQESHKDIDFLEANLFAQKPNKRDGGDGSVELFSFGTVLSEVDHAVAKIIELKNRGYSYMDICLMTGDLDEYGPLVRQTLQDCGIPYYLDEKVPLISNRLAKFLMFSLKNCYTFEAENYIGMIKQGVVSAGDEPPYIDLDTIDRYENYIITKGLKKALTPIDGDREMEQLRKAIKISLLKKAVDKAKTAGELAAAVLDYFTNQNMYFHTELEERAYEKLVEVLERMGEIFKDRDMDIQLFTSVLSTGIGSIDLGTIPEKQDSIIIGNISRTKIERAKCLLVLGVRDGEIPKVTQKSGLISDYDATQIGSGVKLGRDSYDLNSIEQLLTYKMLSKPTDYLYISFSQRNLYGKECDNKMLFKKIKDILNLNVNMDIPFNEEMSLRLLRSKALAFKNLIGAAMMGENNYITRGAMAYFARERNLDNLLRPKKYDLSITREMAKRVYENRAISASRIEEYNRCAFSQFLKYGLGLRGRKEFVIEALDTGSLLHSMMERFTKYLIEEKVADSVALEKIDPMVDQVMDNLLSEENNSVFTKDKASQAMVRRIKEMSKTALRSILSELERTDFVIKYSEADLKHLGDYKIADMPLVGRIDRIDEGAEYIRIIDYKKGTGAEISPEKIYAGIQLQLLLYMNAAIHHYEGKKPGTLEYYAMSPKYTDCKSLPKYLKAEPKEITSSVTAIGGKNALSDEHMAKLLSFGEQKAKTTVEAIYRGDISISPYVSGDYCNCEHCGYKNVCKNTKEENARVLEKITLDEIIEPAEEGGDGNGLE